MEGMEGKMRDGGMEVMVERWGMKGWGVKGMREGKENREVEEYDDWQGNRRYSTMEKSYFYL